MFIQGIKFIFVLIRKIFIETDVTSFIIFYFRKLLKLWNFNKSKFKNKLILNCYIFYDECF